VIIDSEAAAQYFQKIFMHDWQYLAEKKRNLTDPLERDSRFAAARPTAA
jgi:hypothetical protein